MKANSKRANYTFKLSLLFFAKAFWLFGKSEKLDPEALLAETLNRQSQ